MMEAFDKTTLDRFVESSSLVNTPIINRVSSPIVHDHDLIKYFAEFGDDYANTNKNEFESYIPPIPQSRIFITSSNDGDDDQESNNAEPELLLESSASDTDDECTEMRKNINILTQKQLSTYTKQKQIDGMNQQSLKDAIYTLARAQHNPKQQHESEHQMHHAVQNVYEEQQQLLEKLQLLEKDDPNPSGAKLWNIMQRIFTEENVTERQRNIADLKSTLDEKHREVTDLELNEKKDKRSLLRSIHEISKETQNELKKMRQQLDEERKINQELRQKMRKKNRQWKILNNKKETKNENYIMPPISYDPDSVNGGRRANVRLKSDSLESQVDYMEEKESAFMRWCIAGNTGFHFSKTKCSWF